jgi:L-proline amide hydrolase
VATTEGFFSFVDGRTWFRVTGAITPSSTPLIVAHGGPGATHDYLDSLQYLERPGRPVVHYDQFGCGNSTRHPERDATFFTVELFLQELDALLVHLGVADRYHLLGQSWGGMLAAEHAIRQPRGLRGLILSNSPAAMSLWVAEATRLRAAMPLAIRDALDRHEAAGTLDDEEYLAATQAFYDRHVCRVVPNPPEVQRSFASLAQDPTVYRAMNGPNEFYCIGSLKTWSVIDRVHDIVARTLVISGQFDEATPLTVAPYVEKIPHARWELFEQSSHMPFVEEPARYESVVDKFLKHVEEGTV